MALQALARFWLLFGLDEAFQGCSTWGFAPGLRTAPGS